MQSATLLFRTTQRKPVLCSVQDLGSVELSLLSVTKAINDDTKGEKIKATLLPAMAMNAVY